MHRRKKPGKAKKPDTDSTMVSPSIGSASDPISQVFHPRDLPKELMVGIDVEKELRDSAQVDMAEVMMTWMTHKYPTLTQKQDCEDVISMHADNYDQRTKEEIHLGGKLALIAYVLLARLRMTCMYVVCRYAFPFAYQRITSGFHMKNAQFSRYLETFMTESIFMTYKNMDDILEGRQRCLVLPVNAQVSGFFVRTPIRLWDEKLHRVYTIPPWERRTELLNYFLVGNVNAYVLRRNFEDGFECYVTFRGTATEFNGIPQYGRKMDRTPVYQVPQYDPIANQFYPEGSNSVPLFYPHWISMVQDAMPHIEQCLEWLDASSEMCKRIVVSGHSMGGALVLNYAYLMRASDHRWWPKTVFRSFAAPMSCNDAAVLRMEQWIIDSMTPNKFLEVVNTDDFINIQYLLGGKKGLKDSVHAGTNRIGSWLLSSYWKYVNHELPESSPEPPGAESFPKPAGAESFPKPLPSESSPQRTETPAKSKSSSQQPEDDKKILQFTPTQSDTMARMMRIVQMYPEISMSAFLNGALQAQIRNIPEHRQAAFRMGQRQEEADIWGSKSLKETYNGTLKLFFCQRAIEWQSEYIAKSHANYVDLNMSILWAPMRMYEDGLYRYYARHGLQHHNSLRIVGMFPELDRERVESLVAGYHPPEEPPRMLRLFKDIVSSSQHRKPNLADYERTRSSAHSHSRREHMLKKK